MNNDISHTIEYHDATKHSEFSIRMSRHYLDWENKPRPFKVYTNLPSIPLPRDFPKPELSALSCIASMYPPSESKLIDTATLAEVLFFSAGLTRELRTPFGTYFMRAASATGALYPIELYIVCKDIPDLEAGVYHFGPGDYALTKLIDGDYRGYLGMAAGNNEDILSAPVTIAFTSLAWRNAWKYQVRSYRHWFWDSGVIAANFLATTISAGLRSRLILGFKDADVNRLLCLGERKEATIALAPMGIGLAKHPKSTPKDVPAINPDVLPLSKAEVDYPEISKIHEASYLHDIGEVKAWVFVADAIRTQPESAGEHKYPLEPSVVPSDKKLWQVILQRGSTRRFARKPISFAQLSTTLHSSTQGIPTDFLKEKSSIIDIYLIANAVDDIPAGAYFFNRQTQSLEQLKRGGFRNMAGYLCLEQPLFAGASTVFFLMTNLKDVLPHLGNRGYRAAQFEAGVMAGKIYLSAYAQGIGASGSTFYDDAVTEFFSPHAASKNTMMVVAVGFPDYTARPGKILAGRLTKEQLMAEAL